MKANETTPKADTPKRADNRLGWILFFSMLAYGTILLVLAQGGFSPRTVFFVVQCLNAAGFFMALAALVRTRK